MSVGMEQNQVRDPSPCSSSRTIRWLNHTEPFDRTGLCIFVGLGFSFFFWGVLLRIFCFGLVFSVLKPHKYILVSGQRNLSQIFLADKPVQPKAILYSSGPTYRNKIKKKMQKTDRGTMWKWQSGFWGGACYVCASHGQVWHCERKRKAARQSFSWVQRGSRRPGHRTGRMGTAGTLRKCLSYMLQLLLVLTSGHGKNAIAQQTGDKGKGNKE